MSKLIKYAGLVALAVATGPMFSQTAEAAIGTTNACTVTQVFLETANNRFIINCANDGNVYYANPGGTCAVTPFETIKVWDSMAMSAFLSGKKLNLSWNDGCGPRNLIGIAVVP